MKEKRKGRTQEASREDSRAVAAAWAYVAPLCMLAAFYLAEMRKRRGMRVVCCTRLSASCLGPYERDFPAHKSPYLISLLEMVLVPTNSNDLRRGGGRGSKGSHEVNGSRGGCREGDTAWQARAKRRSSAPHIQRRAVQSTHRATGR
jgi:hypothetical protein